MENNRFYSNQSCQKELEQQLKDSFLEIKLLKQENKYLSSTFEEFKLKQEETRKLQSLIVELEQRVLTLEEENAKLESEIGYLRGFSQSKEIQVNQKASYIQLEQELQDLQIYLRKFIQLQELLIEQVPNINVQLCWKEINQILLELNQFSYFYLILLLYLQHVIQSLIITTSIFKYFLILNIFVQQWFNFLILFYEHMFYCQLFIQLIVFDLIQGQINIKHELMDIILQTIFKNQFNTNQQIQNLQDELKLIETTYKELVHQKDNNLTPLSEMAKQQSIRESRVEIERIRKDVQLKQMDLKQFETKLSELQNEFTYISKIETRKNNVQMEAEKQLIEFRRGISTTKNSNHNVSLLRDTFKERDTYKEMIHINKQHLYKKKLYFLIIFYVPERLRDQSDVQIDKKDLQILPISSSIKRLHRPYIEINDRFDDYQEGTKTPIEKTIDQTRKKLSRQLSQASSLRDQKYI